VLVPEVGAPCRANVMNTAPQHVSRPCPVKRQLPDPHWPHACWSVPSLVGLIAVDGGGAALAGLPAVGTKDRTDGADQRGMGFAEQKVSAWNNGYRTRLAGVSTPAGQRGAGHQGVGVTTEDMDWAG